MAIRYGISEPQVTTLDRALDLEERFEAGIFPRNGGQARHFRELVRRGWLSESGWGCDIDGEIDREVLVHNLTDRGRRLVKLLREEHE